MATRTPNLNLYMPDATDDFGEFREEHNDNMVKIDNAIGGGGGSGGHTIVDENGADMPAESKLQFTGAVSVTDDNVNGATVVDVLGGGNGLIQNALIYSTDEQVIGVWTDKKPLYQKTFVFNTTQSSGQITLSTGLLDVDEIILFSGVASYPSGGVNIKWIPLPFSCDSNGYAVGSSVLKINSFLKTTGVIYAYIGEDYQSSYAINRIRITIQYTKTTDVAGSGGFQAYGFSPVIYSDVERVIGVWRDNKPLYQKTIVTTYNSSATSYQIDVSALNLETIGNAILSVGSDNYMAEVGDYYSSYSDHIRWYYERSIEKITIEFGNTYPAKPFEVRLTLQYTKTTDVAGSGDYNTYGVPTVHYDTNEQVIGTWITGKPLYEITVEVNSVNHNDWTDVFSLADADIKGYDSRTSYAQLNNGERVQLDWFVTTSIYNRSIITNSGTKFRVETQGNNYSKIVATIQYTKTTD